MNDTYPTDALASESSPKWKVTDIDSLLWERWGDEYVVFHAPSGKTHFLNASGALILQLLSRDESYVGLMAAEIGLCTATPVDDVLMQQVQQTILRFEQLGLVSRCRSTRAVAS